MEYATDNKKHQTVILLDIHFISNTKRIVSASSVRFQANLRKYMYLYGYFVEWRTTRILTRYKLIPITYPNLLTIFECNGDNYKLNFTCNTTCSELICIFKTRSPFLYRTILWGKSKIHKSLNIHYHSNSFHRQF